MGLGVFFCLVGLFGTVVVRWGLWVVTWLLLVRTAFLVVCHRPLDCPAGRGSLLKCMLILCFVLFRFSFPISFIFGVSIFSSYSASYCHVSFNCIIVGDMNRLSCEPRGIPQKGLQIACMVAIYVNDIYANELDR